MISGTISIDSTPLGGTTIHVRAPLTLTADANADILSEAPSI
jgi:chemotaxis protein histidine kinase CheA